MDAAAAILARMIRGGVNGWLTSFDDGSLGIVYVHWPEGGKPATATLCGSYNDPGDATRTAQLAINQLQMRLNDQAELTEADVRAAHRQAHVRLS